MSSRWLRSALVGSAAVTIIGVAASGQLITYSTTGFFTGPGCVDNFCGFASVGGGGGAAISYTGSTFLYTGSSTSADFGIFRLAALTLTSPNSYVVPAGTMFTLIIFHSGPLGQGLGSISGPVVGTFTLDAATFAAGGGLAWIPATTSFSIVGIPYQIYANQQTGAIDIALPIGLGSGDPETASCGTRIGNPNCTTIQGAVAVAPVPEPSTALLMASGLGVLSAAAFRRRRRKKC